MVNLLLPFSFLCFRSLSINYCSAFIVTLCIQLLLFFLYSFFLLIGMDVSSICSFSDHEEDTPSTAHTSVSDGIADLDWHGLEQSESECADRSDTALLVARLERENARFERDPKALISSVETSTAPRRTRPVSVDELRKIVEVDDFARPASVIAAPLTDLEFWTALVADYPRTATRLPCLLSKKVCLLLQFCFSLKLVFGYEKANNCRSKKACLHPCEDSSGKAWQAPVTQLSRLSSIHLWQSHRRTTK